MHGNGHGLADGPLVHRARYQPLIFMATDPLRFQQWHNRARYQPLIFMATDPL